MNNDELFCYFINHLDYYENHPNEEKELQWYFQYLIDMAFFKEICKDTYKYHKMVRRAVLIFMMINGGQHVIILFSDTTILSAVFQPIK